MALSRKHCRYDLLSSADLFGYIEIFYAPEVSIPLDRKVSLGHNRSCRHSTLGCPLQVPFLQG